MVLSQSPRQLEGPHLYDVKQLQDLREKIHLSLTAGPSADGGAASFQKISNINLEHVPYKFHVPSSP